MRPGQKQFQTGSLLYQRNEFEGSQGSGTAALSIDSAVSDGKPGRTPIFGEAMRSTQPGGGWRDIDLVVDLGAQVGSKLWWRGALTCAVLCGTTFLMAPSVEAIPTMIQPLEAGQWDEARAQAITPLALGGDTGRRMAATDAVEPLAGTPERPRIEMSATLGRGDGLRSVLQRAGVAPGEAAELEGMISDAVPMEDIRPGTVMDIVLGRRPNRTVPRPVDAIAFRARFDLKVEVARVDGALRLNQIQIAVDDTPLRIRGRVGSSLYRSARAAGAPPAAIQEYLRAIGTRMSVNRDIGADAIFDIIVDHRRAETGETETGRLIFAGIERGDRETQLLRWSVGGDDQWFEASGEGQQTGQMLMPINGRLTSGFGYRRHPILGYRRLHTGLDIAAVRGTPIRAAQSGTVNYSGRNRGYGNYVRINHGGGIQTAYAHMSRIVASNGSRVSQGQIIGYVGSTGMSTGPHLHYELIRNGTKVDPRSVSFTRQAQLTGGELQRFRATLANLLEVEPGAALARREDREDSEVVASSSRSAPPRS
ncbi:murein DD-endopeptidase MepM/ murein hydrolase activator NlpD [Parasphingopyxis lamellibrachiae]|uniref:Murein DD-endopeptidase MepM/ murein hydrolase activator NlpD n=1 Tax=Parasphingopyxis lamellibrachiae TaxID=680125 RepID=A0A3D9FGR7_9SPHN|nr:murein DD-endopeptidase MepM/ murein hydrolase activator NlpD [Parasphingopyxis lamellibrachiae]